MATWLETVEPTARKFDLAAKLDATIQTNTAGCAWHALALRSMARIADRARADAAATVASFRLFGLKITVTRDASTRD